MNQEAVFQRREGIMRTKPSIFDNPTILPRLAMAFSIGGTIEEAAHYAGCSVSALKKHIRERTPFHITMPWGEDGIVTFDAMVNSWRAHVTLLAKLTIYKSLFSPDERLATKNAWKILERSQADGWGKDRV